MPTGDLPHVDEHAITIDAPRRQVWTALERLWARRLGMRERDLPGRVLGSEPPGGFAVGDRVPEVRLTLVGRHRFARFALTFELTDLSATTTRVRAVTHAAFPGPHGAAYRFLLLRTGAHVAVTRGLLRSLRRASTGAAGRA